MIPIKNKARCVCIKKWVFNKTKSFDGIVFQVGEIYIVDLGETPNSNLLAVVNHKQNNAYVGLSKQRFVEYFKFVE